MNEKYSKFFEPVKINKMVIKNRFAMAPMGTFTEEANGILSQRTLDYYEERAKGGTGLIISEVQYITNKLDPWIAYITTADTDEQLKNWYNLAEVTHSHGSKLCVQLGCGLGKNAFIFDGDGGDIVSASENPCFYKPDKMARPMTIEEIHETVACYQRAAVRCLTAGVDAIEIHAHAGYILDQFMTPAWNRRTDEYGGSFENRMRFITEVYQAIRGVVGPDYPIIVRMGADHDFKDGRTMEESIEIVQYLEKLGVDAFDIDKGCYEEKKWIVPTPFAGESCMADDAKIIKDNVHVPVLNSGTHTIDSALECLEEGKCDIIMMGRPLVADPDLPNKLFRGQEEDIRPCLFCNECGGRLYKNLYLACAVNTQAANEAKYAIKKAETPRKVVVVGGGPAGMEAARVAKLEGHDVTLYEKSNQLGGQLIPASGPSFKKRLEKFKDWEINQITKLGVNIQLNYEINADSPELEDAYKIIVALGAQPSIPPIKGIDNDNVIEVTEAHKDIDQVKGETILVAGGGQSGCDIAIEEAMKGKTVILVEMQDQIAPEEWNIDNRNPLLFELAKYDIDIMLSTKIVEFNENGAVVQTKDNEIKEIKADTIVTAFGMRPNVQLTQEICGKYSNAAVAVGDSEKLSKIYGAVREGYLAGWSIE